MKYIYSKCGSKFSLIYILQQKLSSEQQFRSEPYLAHSVFMFISQLFTTYQTKQMYMRVSLHHFYFDSHSWMGIARAS